jgi:hypothetical protein
MGRNAPPGFTEFVLMRGSELHRTALLLTHSTASAVTPSGFIGDHWRRSTAVGWEPCAPCWR